MRRRGRLSWWVASLALVAGFAVLFTAVPRAAFAQTSGTAPAKPSSAAAAAEESEEVTVTGTRIGRDNLEEYAPIAVVNSSQIESSGVSSIHELLTQLPSVTLQGLSRNDNNGGDGLAFVDLRNLGVQETLVLVNGKRFPTSNSDVAEAVDLNNIPVSMIDRVEVSLDSGSAVYGSDAVAGVINIILKDNFDGFQFDSYGGVTDKGDGQTVQLSGVYGANSDRGNVTIMTSWVQADEVKQKDRNWSRYPVVAAFYNDDGTIGKITGSGFFPEGRDVGVTGVMFRPDPTTGLPFQDVTTTTTTGEGGQRFNYADDQWLVGKQNRYSIGGTGHISLADHIEAYGEGMFTHRTSQEQLAGEPDGQATNTHPNGWLIPVTNPYLPQSFLDLLESEAPGTTEFSFTKRMEQLGPRTYNNDTDTYRLVSGLRGDIAAGWKYDGYVLYGENMDTQRETNQTNFTRMIQASDPALCAEHADEGCVVGNFFGADSMSPEVMKYIGFTATQEKRHEIRDTGISFTGPTVPLPAGPVKLALGAEYRQEEGFNIPDSVVVAGDAANDSQGITKGGYDLAEGFAEGSIPLLKNAPLAKELTLDAAGRYTSYNTFGDKFVYRGGASYAPASDLRFRAIYGTSFRAPSINDLYGGSVRSFNTAQDPCNNWDTDPNVSATVKANCQAAGVPHGYSQTAIGNDQVPTDIGGNPNLRAEDGKTYSFGTVLTPSVLEGFSFTTDYYWVEVNHSITNPDEQTILDNCYNSPGLSSSDCARIRREPTGAITQVEAVEENIGKRRTDGLDITADYNFDMDKMGAANAGRLDFKIDANYLLNDDEFDGKGVKSIEDRRLFGLFGPEPAWRFYQSSTWTHGGFSFTNVVRYIGSVRSMEVDPTTDPYRRVKAVSYWDISAAYTWDKYTLSGGIDNLLDKDPPFFLEGGQNAGTEGYDFLGRFLFGRISVKI